MKTIVLLALGLVGTDGKKHRHQQKQPKSLQSEVEQLKDKYAALDSKFDKLSKVVTNIDKLQSFVQKHSLV